jgi:hypothetical protein
MGINSSNNPAIEKLLREFYAEAGAGVQVWLMGTSQSQSMANMLDITVENSARKLVETSGGAIRGIIVSHNPANGYSPTITDGINADVWAAIAKGQELGEWSADTKFAPLFVIVDGRNYQGNAALLRDLTQQSDNRVGVLIGDTTSSAGSALGLLAGRIAKIPVQRNIGRVADGAVNSLTMYIKDKAAEMVDVTQLHDKGFITFRTFVGRSGYFFTDDTLATLTSDDYRFLTHRRTADKAYRIAYDTLLNFLLDEIPVTSGGKILPALVKSWQTEVESAIASQMTANGELSADPSNAKDRGVECFIDENQNVISTGKLEMTIRVRPFGYARYIDAKLGFTVISN